MDQEVFKAGSTTSSQNRAHDDSAADRDTFAWAHGSLIGLIRSHRDLASHVDNNKRRRRLLRRIEMKRGGC